MGNKDPESFISQLNNPQIYSGKEINVRTGGFHSGKANVCLVFPDTYEIGMSHQGLKILYHLLDSLEGVNVERAFLPDRESLEIFKKQEMPLFSLESKTPLREFDLVGFSILSELSYTNVLQVLDLSGIPLYSRERGVGFPVIAAGGITAAANPEPLADFMDLFAVGDGEIIFPELIKAVREIKQKNSRDLHRFSGIPGVYVPSLYPVERKGSFWVPDTGGRKVRKEVMSSLDSFPFDKGLIVPIANVVFDRLEVEIARGCPQNCRFCQAKAYYSPYRVKLPSRISEELSESLESTGFESFSLSSLSSGDHPLIGDILENIIRNKRPCLSVSMPSLRPSALTGALLTTLATGRKAGITIVPEAGTERLRRVINKDVSDEDILEAVGGALSHGWQKIKLYFMIGLPTETDADLQGAVELVEKIRRESSRLKKRLKIHVSFSPFVPKPHTVFQWARRDSNEEIYRKTGFLLDRLKRYRNIDLDFHRADKGLVETILSRGDRRTGELIHRVFSEGEIFSAWDSEFHYTIWEKHISDLDLWRFTEELSPDETVPWHYLDFNFSPGYLAEEYRKALKGETTPSCTDMNCSQCRGCGFPYKKEVPPEPASRIHTGKKKRVEEFNKVRLFYKKGGAFSWFSHLSMMKYVERVIRRSGIGFRCTEGFHPRIKMGSIPPLPVFATGEEEVVELFIDRSLSESQILEAVKQVSGDLEFTRAWIVEGRRNLNRDLLYIRYRIRGKIPRLLIDEIQRLMGDRDSLEPGQDFLDIGIDYSDKGAERFAKMYRIIDPGKERTGDLIRREIVFKD